MSIKSIHDGVMRRVFVCLLGSVAFAGAGCTKPNPKNCGDGSCTDPAFPFCDVDGSVGGEPNTCIAVTCTADQFVACRDDLAITCNAQGNNFDEIKCDKGCDPTVGCRVCDPNQTVCADGKLQTCDANGVVTSSETCALGCFEDQPRCRDIDPSNGLATYLDMVSDPPDLNLSAATLDTATGTLTDHGNPVDAPNFLVPTQTGKVPIRVYVVSSATIGQLTIGNISVASGPAFALVSRGDITITGAVVARSSAGGITSDCLATSGNMIRTTTDGVFAAGSGGGGNATNGGNGGNLPGRTPGTGGNPAGSDHLVPLQGGCPGAPGLDENGQPYGDFGGRGGGAIQFSSRTAITINGTIDVRGDDGSLADYGQTGGSVPQGAGAGGGILLEAPSIVMGATGKVLAPGGTGAGCNPGTAACAAGGAGATMGLPARTGADAVTGVSDFTTAGGGGGGWGRIRINTADATYITSNTTVEDGSLTAGILSTR